MTVRENVEKFLFNHGLWPEEAKEVVKKLVAENEPFSGVADKSEEGYPDAFFAVSYAAAKDLAIKHLEENKPQHFALSILKGELPAV